jgi:hypothetical protein
MGDTGNMSSFNAMVDMHLVLGQTKFLYNHVSIQRSFQPEQNMQKKLMMMDKC